VSWHTQKTNWLQFLEYQSQTSEQYHSGILESSLPRRLLWPSGEGSLEKRDQRAPPWSWASVDGPLQFMKRKHTSADAKFITVRHDETSTQVMKATSSSCTLVLLAAVSARESWAVAEPVGFGRGNGTAQSYLRQNGTCIRGARRIGTILRPSGKLLWTPEGSRAGSESFVSEFAQPDTALREIFWKCTWHLFSIA
jgi:hypothetical protein